MELKKVFNTPRSGVILSFASSFLISVCCVGVKLTTIPVGQIVFSTYLGIFCVSVLLTFNTKEKLFPKNELYMLWGRTVFSLPIVIFSYKAVRLLPISDDALIAYTSIIFTIILGKIFLKENCTKDKLFSCAGILFGVFLITAGPAPKNPSYLYGCIFSLLGALFDAGSYIALKELVHLHYSIILFNYSLCSLILTAPFYFFETWTLELLPLITLSLCGTVQELLVTLALSSEQAGLVCMIHASEIIYSYIWELCLFDETYTFNKISGSILVTLSVILSSYSHDDSEDYLKVKFEEDEKEDILSKV